MPHFGPASFILHVNLLAFVFSESSTENQVEDLHFHYDHYERVKKIIFLKILFNENVIETHKLRIASLNLLHGFIVLIGDKSSKPMATMTPDNQTTFVMLFIVSVLAFSSNLFFAKLGNILRQKLRKMMHYAS